MRLHRYLYAARPARSAAAVLLLAMVCPFVTGCQSEDEKILEIETPNTDIEVEKSGDGSQIEIRRSDRPGESSER